MWVMQWGLTQHSRMDKNTTSSLTLSMDSFAPQDHQPEPHLLPLLSMPTPQDTATCWPLSTSLEMSLPQLPLSPARTMDSALPAVGSTMNNSLQIGSMIYPVSTQQAAEMRDTELCLSVISTFTYHPIPTLTESIFLSTTFPT